MSNLYEYETPCGEKKRGLADYSNELLDNNYDIFDINEHIIREGSKIIYKNILFDDMKIPFHLTLEKELKNGINDIEIINCIFEKDVFINKEFANLSLKNCCFEGKFYINNQYNNPDKVLKIDSLNIQDTKFHANFKLHNSEVKHFVLKDTDFEKNADFFRTKFLTTEDIVFHTINFRALALFGETVFSEYLIFKYVTFQGYSHFREAVFKKGLNLEYANIEKEMNFFGIKELDEKTSIENTNQETYRIVKYQLQKVGNIIDSNKYHALELEKKRKKICNFCDEKNRSFLDCLVLNIHKLSSNYSTNWFISLLWILVVGLIFNLYITNELLSMNIFKYISLLTNKEDFCSNYLLFILNKVMLGYLYYQFLTAIRKDTRK
ncbi:hypothetical protein CRU86_02395 [Aliarcobacter skirrowii]|uniref:hypothetical protein n=1 Tax=Aliarcobacter skirrowii TaxID=28200 RepID=UPI00100BF7B9|nr:hypothetical protein [Aliarcobacter skirrowii]RXJ79842.1 hypothetical protein CRU86_02395 [Aliarcobacter skirrowii]